MDDNNNNNNGFKLALVFLKAVLVCLAASAGGLSEASDVTSGVTLMLVLKFTLN